MPRKKLFIILSLIAVILTTLLLWWLFWKSAAEQESMEPEGEATAAEEGPAISLGEDIFEKTNNPLKDEIPESNPFEKEINPFKNIYKNPFAK